MTAAERWAHRGNSDLFGLSDYLGHPAFLFVVWGKLGELFGGVDLGTMRALHGAVSLLAVAASYFLFRQLMPRRWAIVAVLLLGLSHSLFMIGRLAMRETSALLVEVVALALLLRGLRHRAPFPTFLGGAVAGLGYYVYQPARSIIVVWLLFLVVLLAFARERFPARRLAGSAAVALSAFALVAAPVVIAELKAPADQATLSRESLLVFDDARQLQRDWVFADGEWEGVRTNIGYGLGRVQQQRRRPRLDLHQLRPRRRRSADRRAALDRRPGRRLACDSRKGCARVAAADGPAGPLVELRTPRQQGAELHAPARPAPIRGVLRDAGDPGGGRARAPHLEATRPTRWATGRGAGRRCDRRRHRCLERRDRRRLRGQGAEGGRRHRFHRPLRRVPA